MQICRSCALDSTLQALFRNTKYLKISEAQMEKRTLATDSFLQNSAPALQDVSTYNFHQITLCHCFSFTVLVLSG